MTAINELLDKYKNEVTNSSKEEKARAYGVLAKELYRSNLSYTELRPLEKLHGRLREELGKEYEWYMKAIGAVESALRFFRDPRFASNVEERKSAIHGLKERELKGKNELMYKEGSELLLEAIGILESELNN